MLIFNLLLLPVRNIGKDFRCPLWIPCLLLNPFHPKNTSYKWHAIRLLRYFTRDIVLQVVKEIVVSYRLASFSVNIDGDWSLTICAKFLLIKEK